MTGAPHEPPRVTIAGLPCPAANSKQYSGAFTLPQCANRRIAGSTIERFRNNVFGEFGLFVCCICTRHGPKSWFDMALVFHSRRAPFHESRGRSATHKDSSLEDEARAGHTTVFPRRVAYRDSFETPARKHIKPLNFDLARARSYKACIAYRACGLFVDPKSLSTPPAWLNTLDRHGRKPVRAIMISLLSADRRTCPGWCRTIASSRRPVSTISAIGRS